MSNGKDRRFRRILRVTGGLIAGAAFLLLSACQEKPAFTPPPPPKVTVSRPLRQDVTVYLERTGNTQAINTVELEARVEGYLNKVFFKDGEMVKKEQPLFLIQQNAYVARLQQAEGNVLNQKALLDHAKTEFKRYSGLYRKKAAAETEVDNWRYQRDSAQAGLMIAQAQRDLARLDLGYTRITAPFDGRMDRRLVDPGNLVGSGQNTVLSVITQMDPLYIYFNVSERDIAPLVGNSKAIASPANSHKIPVFIGLTHEEGYPHEGYLDFTSTDVAQSTGTLLVRGVFPNPHGRMRPGQFARVRIPVGVRKSALLVPQDAVAYDQVGAYVLVVDEKNVVERRGVKTGITKGSQCVIEDGLTANERVIVKGLLGAIPGRQVTPEQKEEGSEESDGGTAGHGAGQ